jgi:5-methylcytosine-specific restriction protein B
MFTSEGFKLLRMCGGKKYDKNNSEDIDLREKLAIFYKNTEDWAKKLQEKKFPDGHVNIKKSTFDQSQKFFPYQWAKIYPHKNSPKEVAYTVSISDPEGFVVKIDTVNQKGNVRKAYENLRDEHFIKKTLSESDGLKLSLEELVDWSKDAINEFNLTYEKVLDELKIPASIQGNNKTLFEDNVQPLHALKMLSPPPFNQILYGPPGTGKTYNTVNKAINIANPTFDLTQKRDSLKQEFDRLMKEGQIVFTTFHQSMNYEDFIEGIKPLKPLTDDSFVKYDIQPGIFKQICDKAKSNFENAKTKNKGKASFEDAFEKLKEDCEFDTNISFQLKTEGNDFTVIGFTSTSIQFRKASGGTNHTLSINTLKDLYYGLRTLNFNQGLGIYYPSILEKLESYSLSETRYTETKAFVLIIDEINRGNVSQIFGELITLIEDDKRLDCDEALEVTLPYSKVSFGVPKNLYIIGTMNTADRSVEALDAALRRRFSFEEMPPKSDLIRTAGKLKETQGILESDDFDDIDLPFLLERINERLEKLLDKDHQIGHSYFMSVESLIDLKLAFQNKIIPLLQEYFFGDYAKIGLVLGKGFVYIEKDESNKNIFANFPDADASDFTDNIIYKIKTFEMDQKSNDVFIKAINSLLNKNADGE